VCVCCHTHSANLACVTDDSIPTRSLTSHVNITCEHHMWTSHVNITCEHHMWTSHVNITCKHNRHWSYIVPLVLVLVRPQVRLGERKSVFLLTWLLNQTQGNKVSQPVKT
jgi:hypothetical protein